MRRLTTRIVPLIAAFAVMPAAALAQAPTGGAEAPTGPPSPFQLSGGGNAMVGKKVRFRGAVEPRLAGRPVVVQYLDPVTQRWTKQARTTVEEDGTFVARWKPERVGQFRTRALVLREAQTASASPELALNVFRPAVATWYGPGFYGNTTACGIELTEETIGIAHRSLPCGTNVAVRYGSTTIVVPVIDRGPYSGEAKWDLTAAAAQMLGFTETDRIGAIRLDPPAQPASK